MDKPCVWFYVWTKNRFVEDWYHVVSYRSFSSCRRYAESVLDKCAFMSPEFKFEKVCFLNGSIVKREFIA